MPEIQARLEAIAGFQAVASKPGGGVGILVFYEALCTVKACVAAVGVPAPPYDHDDFQWFASSVDNMLETMHMEFHELMFIAEKTRDNRAYETVVAYFTAFEKYAQTFLPFAVAGNAPPYETYRQYMLSMVDKLDRAKVVIHTMAAHFSHISK